MELTELKHSTLVERSETKYHPKAVGARIQRLEVIEPFEKRRIALLCIMQLANTNRSIERLLARG
jgi:hypothetical protein